MANKVRLAIIDETLKIEIKKYPVSDTGKKIRVVSGGENHFMPDFDNYSYLDFPRKFLFWIIGHERLYFAKKGAKKCVNFKTDDGTVYGPDPEEQKKAIGSTLLGKIGKPEKEGLQWWQTLLIILNIGIALKVFGVI